MWLTDFMQSIAFRSADTGMTADDGGFCDDVQHGIVYADVYMQMS